jgi:glycosyltransferase involved in cell wall biosynthesis
MRVLITTTQVPFIRGGAEILAEGLRSALRAAGHQAEIVTVPFKWYPPERILDHMLACRLLDLTEVSGMKVDRVIGLKFPAYLIQHPNKVLWLLHQHRTAYDLWDHPLGDLLTFPNGVSVRDAIRQADNRLIPESRAVYTIAANVSGRLKKFNGIDSTPIYHPPQQADKFYCARADDYLFFPSRIAPLKRQVLVLEALTQTKNPVRVRFAGSAEYLPYGEQLQLMAQRSGISDRVEWLGHLDEDTKRDLYAQSLAVIFPPLDEDYGYVTLEAMVSRKAVLTLTDYGGPLEFVKDEKTGWVVAPTAPSLAGAMDRAWEDRGRAARRGEAGREHYEGMKITWNTAVKRLLV